MAGSTPPSTSPSNGKLESTGEKQLHGEHGKEKPGIASTEPSTETSSVLNGVDEKPDHLQDEGPATPDEEAVGEEEAPQDTPSYPKGMEVFFIMLALVLSIMLVSLDQVRLHPPSPTSLLS
jgi:hypothetical protein